jgi:hypothetical protein
MTAIRGYVAPTTEALGVHSLDQFVLAVRRPQAGGLVLPLGSGGAARVHHQL